MTDHAFGLDALQAAWCIGGAALALIAVAFAVAPYVLSSQISLQEEAVFTLTVTDLINAKRVPDILEVLTQVLHERTRQDAKWGEQNHPDGTGGPGAQADAETWRAGCKAAAAGGYVTWGHILGEEVAEALAEADPTTLRAELVQVAAVAVAWIQAIDRRAGVA